MSTDYRLHIKRKCDDKTLAIFHCNLIKNLLDSKHASIIHCGDYSIDKQKFTYDELENLSVIIRKEVEEQYLKLNKLDLMLLSAKSEAAIENIKDEIAGIKDYMEESLIWQFISVHEILGHIQCVVENLYRKNTAAYEYNVKDLNESGKDSHTIWCSDVYCQIESC